MSQASKILQGSVPISLERGISKCPFRVYLASTLIHIKMSMCYTEQNISDSNSNFTGEKGQKLLLNKVIHPIQISSILCYFRES